jgi:hypothetical protein
LLCIRSVLLRSDSAVAYAQLLLLCNSSACQMQDYCIVTWLVWFVAHFAAVAWFLTLPGI